MLKREKYPTALEMKMIINNVYLVPIVVLLFLSCKGVDRNEEGNRTVKEIIDEVNVVQAIGKVSPGNDWVILSSPISARIQKMLVAEGDSVAAGQVLFLLESNANTNEIEVAKARLSGLQAENRVSLEELKKAKLSEQDMHDRYQTSRRLYEQNAETREKMEEDYFNWQQQVLTVRGLEYSLKAQKEKEIEQRIQVKSAEDLLADYRIVAPVAGVLAELSAKLGQSVNSAQVLGKIIDFEDPIVIAEVDELFANDIKVGQEVWFSNIGSVDTIGRGEIMYVSPVLSDKSILYELANEGKDRRVRKIKIGIDVPVNVPINAKVDCQIKIR